VLRTRLAKGWGVWNLKAAVRSTLALLERLNTAAYYLIGGILALISVVVLVQVLVRFVLTHLGLNISAPWTEELARFLLVWLIFLGAAVGCRRMQLISLDFVLKALPGLIGQAARYIALGLCLYLFMLLVIYGHQFVRIIGATELSPVMQISKSWVYWAMPVGGALMIINTLAFIAEALVDGKDIRAAGGIADTD
jgi:TRAP-type C4-dicarboxylate transport system permease small subunit